MYSIVLGLVFLLFWRFVKYQFADFIRHVQFYRESKGPSLKELARNSAKERILPFLVECSIKYGSKFCIFLSTDLIMFITNPEDARVILSSQELTYKSNKYQILERWLGNGLLLAGGEKWQKSRKFLTPAFYFNILKEFKSAMDECCGVLIRKLDKVATGQSVDIYPFITLFALDVICETALGTKKNAQESDSEYVQAVKRICSIFHERSFNFFLRTEFFYKFSSLYESEKQLLKVLHNETNRVIEERRAQISSWDLESTEKVLQTYDSEYGRKRRFAFLDMLLIGQMEGKDISNKQIREEVDTFMFEGHDTTASAISFAIYELSKHPQFQQKAYMEALEFEGKENEQMKYLEAVIKETLRLYPSVPFYSRNIMEDFKLGDKILPKGLIVTILAYALHRDPETFKDPNVFNPERYLTDDQFHAYSNVAFSAGPRNCIGQRFAMLEMKSVLAKILRNFEFGTANEAPTLLAEIILKSDTGVHVTIKKRTK